MQVLRGLSFTVQPNSCVAIVGPSGTLFVCVLLCRSASLVSLRAFLRPRRHQHASLDGPPAALGFRAAFDLGWSGTWHETRKRCTDTASLPRYGAHGRQCRPFAPNSAHEGRFERGTPCVVESAGSDSLYNTRVWLPLTTHVLCCLCNTRVLLRQQSLQTRLRAVPSVMDCVACVEPTAT